MTSSDPTIPRLAEFIGFPGAGKTTIAEAAIRRFHALGIPPPYFYSRDGKLRFQLHESGHALQLVLAATARLARGGHVRQLSRFLPVIKNLLTFRRTRRLLTAHPLIIHNQGLIQRLYLLRDDDHPTQNQMEAVLELLRDDLSEFHVVIDIPPDVAAARYFARAKSSSRRPYKGWDERRIASLYAAQQEVLNHIIRWLETQPATRVLRLDGELPPEENGAVLVECLLESTTPLSDTRAVTPA
ncbi:hypothetical protein B1C78_11405 [Thioalkalivibrio denitrificans]|uniref:Thymidylate kinase n=1 Tax=Thioalkalivibrio denitrificans TaxID=108003 RepID=A0A1V3NED8_9GAMM|nr:hypothetical protein [Thioalkalivibrio denitrificans]OOG23421.1 hypothetical protein B1C78_11405 [Thioalkalivibrio denitrificans]